MSRGREEALRGFQHSGRRGRASSPRTGASQQDRHAERRAVGVCACGGCLSAPVLSRPWPGPQCSPRSVSVVSGWAALPAFLGSRPWEVGAPTPGSRSAAGQSRPQASFKSTAASGK